MNTFICKFQPKGCDRTVAYQRLAAGNASPSLLSRKHLFNPGSLANSQIGKFLAALNDFGKYYKVCLRGVCRNSPSSSIIRLVPFQRNSDTRCKQAHPSLILRHLREGWSQQLFNPTQRRMGNGGYSLSREGTNGVACQIHCLQQVSRPMYVTVFVVPPTLQHPIRGKRKKAARTTLTQNVHNWENGACPSDIKSVYSVKWKSLYIH